MKKTSILKQIAIALFALIIGFLAGYTVQHKDVQEEDLAGSIGKLDRYRNVKVTEEDLLLRNELVEDTLKRTQYQQYLMYYYYQALRTTSDAKQVLSRTTKVSEFNETYYPYADALENFQQYVDHARNDILEALTLIVSLDDNTSLPVISYLNQAQNAIARIRHHDGILLNYMNAIETFIDANPNTKFETLEEAHDLLYLNLASSAVLTQNKPALSYLDKKQIIADKSKLKELSSGLTINAINQQFMQDADMLGIDFPCICNMEQLSSIMYTNMEQLNWVFGQEQLGQLLLLNDESMSLKLYNEQFISSQIDQLESFRLVVLTGNFP